MFLELQYQMDSLFIHFQDQYIFLHEAMVEFIKSGQTGMNYGEFQATFANILQSDPGTQVMTRIKKELLVCIKICLAAKYSIYYP